MIGVAYHLMQFDISNWKKECKFSYSCQVTAAPDGVKQAIRFEWQKKDYDGSRSSKSAEYRTISYTRFPEFRKTREAWISFKIYFSSEMMGIDSQPMILTQYHDIPDIHLGEDWRHPITALSYVNGKLNYSYRGDTNSVTQKDNGEWSYSHPIQEFSLGSVRMDQWNSFVYHHRFDQTGKGLLEIWNNGKYYSRSSLVLGYNDQKGPYWKFGVYYYRGHSDHDTRTAYFSDVNIVLGKASYAEMSS